MEETRIYHNTPKIKQQPKQWVFMDEPASKKAKVGLSLNKVVARVFWDARGIFYITMKKKSIVNIVSIYWTESTTS